MGYTTRFSGIFPLDRQLTPEHARELWSFNDYEAPKPRTPGGGFSRQKGPEGQPEWDPCQWVPTRTLDGIEWDGGEKFYAWEEWLRWIVEKRLVPWGYRLTGSVTWTGESRGDAGVLSVRDGIVTATKDVNLGDPSALADRILAAIDAGEDRQKAILDVLADLTKQGHYEPTR